MNEVAGLLDKVEHDTWRDELGFSPEVEDASAAILGDHDKARISGHVGRWLERHQPCLFGRIAAKFGLLRYCILLEDELLRPDDEIRQRIQDARLAWTRDAYEGKASGFLIVCISQRLALAQPNAAVKELAKKICSLYLLEEIADNKVHLEEVYLEKPGSKRITWTWNAGVNYFAAHGDRRWWQDHRLPGGIAFSVNSVGHMVKSGVIAHAMTQLDSLVGVPGESLATSKVDSLEKALELAMRTIALAANTPYGRATELLPMPTDPGELPVQGCPVRLPSFLRDKNFCTYAGYYHTDHTIPSIYFRPDVARPAEAERFMLDFTYLFNDVIDNPDFRRMGAGRRIRVARDGAETRPQRRRTDVDKGRPWEVMISSRDRLVRALQLE